MTEEIWPLDAPAGPQAVANREVAFPVRFGGPGATAHAMTVGFGPALYGEPPTDHLLTTIGTYRHVVHDAVVWDYALRAFALGDTDRLDELAETLDLGASLCGGVGRSLQSTVFIVLDILRGMLTPGFLVIGCLGAIIFFYSFYYMLLAVVAQWAFGRVVIPGLVAVALCFGFGVCNARLRRLHDAVLAATRSALSKSLDKPWSNS